MKIIKIHKGGFFMNLKEQGQDAWNDAYTEGGNMLFYPHEDIVRFINKYIRKRTNISEFVNIMQLSDTEWKNFKSIDVGCGVGRHVKFLDEFSLNPYGIDLSTAAIEKGKEWMNFLGKKYLADKMVVGSVTELPYEDNFFDIAVSHSVLDCMPRILAKKGFDEIVRVLKKNGMLYLDFYMDKEKGDGDTFVQEGFDKGVIKSYFTVDSLKEFIGNKAKIVEFKVLLPLYNQYFLRQKVLYFLTAQ